jgi:hypothetical protein
MTFLTNIISEILRTATLQINDIVNGKIKYVG